MPIEITDVAGGQSGFSAQSNTLNAQIDAVKKKYEPRISALQAEGNQLKEDAPKPEAVEAVINVDFEVTWSDQTIIFDFPEITLKDKRIVFDLPEVKMELQRIVFDLPAVRMVDKKVGQYPEIHGWTVEWKDIIVSVPETYMQRNEIKLDIPTVTMKHQEIVLGLPEFTMKQVKWIIGLPQFKVINVSAATDKIKERGKNLQTEGEAIGLAMNAEINELVGKLMQGAGGVAGAIDTTRNAFNSALTSLKSSIDTLSQKGVDPIKVPTDAGDVNLRKTFDELVTTRDEVMPKLEEMAAASQNVNASAKLEPA